MGAGSSTEQRSPEQPEAGSATPAEPQPVGGGGPAAEVASGAPGDPGIAAPDPATKLLQKNGQLSTVNGLAEPGELSLQEGALNGQEEEVIVTDVGQRESENVSERDSDKEMAAHSAVVQDLTKDGQEEMPEIIEQIPSSESNLEELAQPAESQTNDVGFKKVFKFVGFKFTVKKDKSEKSDTVQLLTVRKDEGEGAGEADGAGDHQEPSQEAGEATPKESELEKSAEKSAETLKHEQGNTEISLQAESGQAAEEGKPGEEKQEKEPTKSPDSPTSPMASETASPFKKFFTQGWAGWRKKTSFRKPKEDELEASEKKQGQEPERADTEENKTTEGTPEKLAASEQPHPQETPEGVSDARLSADYEKVELPSEGQVQRSPEEKSAPLATEVFDEKVEIVAEVHVSTVEERTEEQKTDVEETEESLAPEKLAKTRADPQEGEPAEELVETQAVCAPGGDPHQPPEPRREDPALSAHPEAIVSEVEMLSSQERVKVQGSPLKKLFTSTGLKKLSGKKQKAKRGGGDEESGEPQQVAAESPDSTDEQKGESSASSPEEPEEITCLEKGIVGAPQEEEVEEGTTSDGEKKREGVTPWASFKKMVTPKKRVRRLSESDREDDLEKVKSATLSSTESAASETQEEGKEGKGHGEEPKSDEPKRKVDTSVSWEAFICVGSSKKRARKTSSSDEEGAPKPTGGESQNPEEARRDKEARPDTIPASPQEHDPGHGSSSPEQAGSPSEGEGVSTWESFKRLVTAKKKSKSKVEEKNEDSGTGLEQSASDMEPGKEESWVSIKKFIPGRRKKRSDGKQAPVEDTRPTEVNEDDSDVPAVVPLSEYDAVEREKMEAQEVQEAQKGEETSEQKAAVTVSEEVSKSLVHTVKVAVIDGARAITSIEERSPSWISASVTEPPKEAEDEATPPAGEVFEREVTAEETPTASAALPESQDTGDDVITSEGELTSEAVTAAETTEPLGAEEGAEASGAEETTDMVSAVSQLTDSPDTTEEATPVQEAEGGVPDVADQERRTQEILQAVAEKVAGESRLSETRGPEDTVQTMQKVGSKILEKVEEAEEDCQGLDLKREMEVVLEVHAEETKTESLTRGKASVQATPEHFEKVPQVTERVESSELTTSCQAEALAGVKSEILLEQVVAPDSAETLTDSETNGSTPVADFEAPCITQQDKSVEIQEDNEVAAGTLPQLAEAAPVLKERPPEPSDFQSQEENTKHSKMGEVLEHTDQEVLVETVPVFSKTEVIQVAGQFADEETKDGPFVDGLEVSADTEITVSQKEIIEDACKDEVTQKADFQKSDDTEPQSQAQSLPTPVEKEMIVQVEREEVEAKPAQVDEKKLERKPAEELSKQLVQTVPVTVIDEGKEVTSFDESSPILVQEELVCTEIQVQSSEPSLPLTAAAVEEKVLGETVKILETAVTLVCADVHLEPEDKSSETDEDLPAPWGREAVPAGTESQAEWTPVVSAAPEKDISADLEGEKTTSLRGMSDEDDQVSCQEVRVSETREEDSKPGNEILQLKTESRKLVQNVIQTAVGQLASTEETAADGQTPAQLIHADNQEAGQKLEQGQRELQVSGEEETPTTAAREESALTAAEQTLSGIPEDVLGALKDIVTTEGKSSGVNGQQLEEVILPIQAKGEATGMKSVLEDNWAELGERAEKSVLGSQEDEKGDAVDHPDNQTSALEGAEASGGLTRESPDANGPKLKEKEVEGQEGDQHRESEKEVKTQTQEETQKRAREAAPSELTES